MSEDHHLDYFRYAYFCLLIRGTLFRLLQGGRRYPSDRAVGRSGLSDAVSAIPVLVRDSLPAQRAPLPSERGNCAA
jgi:hypothetical protein